MRSGIVLVDGGYFDYINRYAQDHYGSAVNIKAFGEKLSAHFDSQMLRLKYYHSLPYIDNTKPTPQEEERRRRAQSFFDTIDNLPHCQYVKAGRVQLTQHTCPHCNESYKIPTQKGTDVQIAVDLVKMAFDPHSPQSFIVVSGDEDLKHGLRVAKDTHSNIYLGYAYNPEYDLYSSQVIRQEADDKINIVDGFLHDVLLN